MMFKTHVVFGFLVGLFLIQFMHPANQILFMTLVVLASILPDIDHPDSKLGKKVKIIGFLFEHRGFFHSVFALVLFSFPVFYFLNPLYGLAVLAGYLSHMAIDCLTHQGIMPFHPLSRQRISGFIATNSSFEFVIFILIAAFDLYKLLNL